MSWRRVRTDIYGFSFILLVSILFLLTPIYFEVQAYKAIPKLEDNISEIESLIGDYTEFYVIASDEYNVIPHSIGSTTLDDRVFLLLPSSVSLNSVAVDFYTMWDEKLATYICDFEKYPEYTIKGKTFSVVQSDLQFVFIDVKPEALNKVNESHREGHEQKEKASVTVKASFEDGLKGQIKPRGSATWNLYGKLPYNLKLDAPKDMFGLGPDKKWNLLANASDKTLLKNEEFFKLGRELGLDYTPKIKNVNLFINSDYAGVYAITTKVDKGKNRVNIGYNDFLINLDAPNYETQIEYNCHFWVNDDPEYQPYVDLVYPDKNSVNPAIKRKVQTKVQNLIDTIECGNDADFSTVMDMESFAKYYWVQEISMNADGLFRSTYMYYKDRDDKFYAGPLWDMEWTLGSTLMVNGVEFRTPTGWKLRNNSYYEYMFKNKAFADEVKRVYYDYDIEKLMYDLYDDYLDQAEEIQVEGEINYRMSMDEGNFFDLDSNATNYKEWVEEKTNFYKTRIDWIAQEMRS